VVVINSCPVEWGVRFSNALTPREWTQREKSEGLKTTHAVARPDQTRPSQCYRSM